MLCFGGSILGNLLVGEALITPFKNHQDVLTACAVWYLVNYSPFDLVYKIIKLSPIKLFVYCMKEIQRTNKIYHGVMFASKAFPGSYMVIAIIGVVKGCGYLYLRNLERLTRGLWIPSSNEFLQPSFVTKGSLAAAILFIMEKKGYIDAPHVLVYFGVVVFFVYFRLSSILLGIHDPFVPFENLFCAIFMGGMWDAMRRAVTREKKPEETDVRSNGKTHEEKKRD